MLIVCVCHMYAYVDLTNMQVAVALLSEPRDHGNVNGEKNLKVSLKE